MSSQQDFVGYQQQLADSIRNQSGGLNGIEQRRVEVYQQLFFNNVEGFCSSGFPVLKSLYSEQQWLSLVQLFFKTHSCSTPHFSEIAGEFLGFIAQLDAELLIYPFAVELAHYEWAELVVSTAQDDNGVSNLESVSETSKLQLCKPCMPLQYQYPVHQISADNKLEISAELTNLVVFRNSLMEVEFIKVDTLSLVMLQLIQQHDQSSVSELQQHLTPMLPNMAESDLQQFITKSCGHFVSQNILLAQ